ncbi:MAG: hypothetical protein ACXVNF_13950 [Neobacillus sp.]
MKKKRLFTTLVSILMIFVIAGCSNSGDSNQTSAASNGNGNTGNTNRPGFQKPDLYGEVSAIDGNKVTLKLLEMPQMTRRNGQNGQNGSNGSGNGTGNNGSNGGYTGRGNGGAGRGGMRVKKYTGEVKTIEIPNGVSLVTMTRGTNGMSESTISLNDLTTGSTLSIYYNSDGKTIGKIRVQKPWTGNGQAGTTGN